DGERFDAQILLSESAQLSVQSLIDADKNVWQEHLAARVSTGAASTRTPLDRDAFIESAERHIDGKTFYRYFRDLGYTLGPSFCWIADVWIRGEEALVRYAQPVLPDAVGDYEIYPGLIDSCFQSIAGFMVDDEAAEAPSLAIPFAAGKLSFVGRPDASQQLFGHVRIKRADPLPRGRVRVEVADLHMFTERGQTVFAADEFRVRHAPRAVLEASLRAEVPNAYAVHWVALERAEHAAPRTVALLGDVDGSLAQAFRAAGSHVAQADVHALPTDVDLLVDARDHGDDPVAAASSLAHTLVSLPSELPYALLSRDEASAAPARESLWGMLNAIEAEQGQRRLVRLRSARDTRADAIVSALSFALESGEHRLALRADGLYAPRLTRAESAQEGDAFRGSVLVTGGLGALGLSVAQIAAEQGARAIVLMGRSQPDAVAERVIEQLRARDVQVEVVRGDVSKREDCQRAIAVANQHAPLSAVLHLAGKNEDKALERLTRADFDVTFGGKVSGALALVDALRGQSLSTLIFFSSVASGLGSAGQANYAAANGFLDGLAEQLRAEGVRATAVNWGPWVPRDKQGMAAHEAVLKASERAGLRALDDDDARALLALAAAGEGARLIAMRVDLARYVEHLGDHPRARFVRELAGASSAPRASSEAALPKGWLGDALQSEAEDERELALLGALRKLVGEVLGNPDVVDDRAGFAELGLDSIMAIDVRTRLSLALACDLPATLAIDYPSVSALASYVHGRLFAVVPAPAPTPQPAEVQPELPSELGELSLEQLLNAVQPELAAGE
ncbi:MAG TPA: SDR family NAD(P)-dependent oxidoreductase, partial [Polyangiales bacterium]